MWERIVSGSFISKILASGARRCAELATTAVEANLLEVIVDRTSAIQHWL
jgi:hypothetical protein